MRAWEVEGAGIEGRKEGRKCGSGAWGGIFGVVIFFFFTLFCVGSRILTLRCTDAEVSPVLWCPTHTVSVVSTIGSTVSTQAQLNLNPYGLPWPSPSRELSNLCCVI